jgi:hypothetical protein
MNNTHIAKLNANMCRDCKSLHGDNLQKIEYLPSNSHIDMRSYYDSDWHKRGCNMASVTKF